MIVLVTVEGELLGHCSAWLEGDGMGKWLLTVLPGELSGREDLLRVPDVLSR